MPWPIIKLNDGTRMPSIAYGHIYWVGQDKIAGDVGMAIDAGFTHLDTAQGYYDEDKFAEAIKTSGRKRKDMYITTKWSRSSTDIKDACENSLRLLNVDQVDLYLIHDRELCGDDIKGCWERMELVKKLGYTKSIGVSNFEIHDLKVLMSTCTIKPSVNQILFDPHTYAETTPLLEYCAQHSIIIEAYTALGPLRLDPDGLIARVTSAIARRLDVQPEQVLMAWVKSKGAAVVTSSSKKERMEKYIAAGDLELSPEDIQEIDEAGRKTMLRKAARRHVKSVVKWVMMLGVVGIFAWGACTSNHYTFLFD